MSTFDKKMLPFHLARRFLFHHFSHPVAQGVFWGVHWLTFGALLALFGALLVLFGSLLVHRWLPLVNFWSSFLLPLGSLLLDVFF